MFKATSKIKYTVDGHIATLYARRKDNGKWAIFGTCHIATVHMLKSGTPLKNLVSLIRFS